MAFPYCDNPYPNHPPTFTTPVQFHKELQLPIEPDQVMLKDFALALAILL